MSSTVLPPFPEAAEWELYEKRLRQLSQEARITPQQIVDVVRTVLNRSESSSDGSVVLTEDERKILNAASEIFIEISFLPGNVDDYVIQGGGGGNLYVRDWVLLEDVTNSVLQRVV